MQVPLYLRNAVEDHISYLKSLVSPHGPPLSQIIRLFLFKFVFRVIFCLRPFIPPNIDLHAFLISDHMPRLCCCHADVLILQADQPSRVWGAETLSFSGSSSWPIGESHQRQEHVREREEKETKTGILTFFFTIFRLVDVLFQSDFLTVYEDLNHDFGDACPRNISLFNVLDIMIIMGQCTPICFSNIFLNIMSFKTCKWLFLVKDTKEDILMNIKNQTINGPHWLIL